MCSAVSGSSDLEVKDVLQKCTAGGDLTVREGKCEVSHQQEDGQMDSKGDFGF